MKKLEKILESIEVLNDLSLADQVVNDVQIDSRQCTEGSLFIAYQGYAQDSHEYIDSAVANGAKYVILDNCLLYTSPSPRDRG